MDAPKRSSRYLPYFLPRVNQDIYLQRESRKAQSNKKFQSVRSSHVYPSTAATHRDKLSSRRYEKNSFCLSDLSLYSLKENVHKEMELSGSNYSGNLHVAWSKNLFKETRGKISPSEKNKYIDELYLATKSIKYWSAQNAAHFYTGMSKLHLFSDIKSLNSSSKLKAEKILSELLEVITVNFYHFQNSNETKIHNIQSLFWAISINDFVKNRSPNQFLAKDLLRKIIYCLYSYQEPLNPYFHNEIMNYISRLNKIHEYKGIFDELIEKNVNRMITFENTKQENLYFSKFFVNFVSAIDYSISSKSFEKDIDTLINKIDFTNDVNSSHLGLRAIAIILFENKLNLSEKISNQLKTCLEFIKENISNLDTNGYINVALSISTLCNILTPFPKAYLEIMHICLNKLERETDKLNLKELNRLLQIVNFLSSAGMPSLKFYKLALKVLENRKKELSFLPNEYIHSLFCKLSRASKNILSEDTKQFSEIKPTLSWALIASIQDLLKKYSKYLFSAQLSVKNNGYLALTNLLTSLLQSNASNRNLLRDLFDNIENELEHSHPKNKELTIFLKTTMQLIDVIEIDVKKYTNLFIKLANRLIDHNEPNSRKKAALWSMLVFFASKKEQLDTYSREKLRNTIEKLYLNIDGEISRTEDRILRLAEIWIKREHIKKHNFISTPSDTQERILKQLQKRFRFEKFETEVSISNLPPVDIIIRDKKIVIEIQGPHHYLGSDSRYRTGKTLLKLESYREAGFKVLEVCCNDTMEANSMKKCIDEIEKIVSKPRFS